MPAILFWLMLLVFSLSCAALAQDQNGEEKPTAGDDRIRIVADKLFSDPEKQFAEFAGNVTATQGNAVVKADRLRIYYRVEEKDGQQAISGEQPIDRVEVSGNVTIHFEDTNAKTEQANYDVQKRVLELVGPDSRISNGPNFIVGNRIRLHRGDGRIEVIGGSGRQVQAEFYSDENVLN